ncbi:MAG: DNA-binding protein [Sphingobacteriales bacterium]|nr:MAG: DNA-binding protein [Sphingobacteriales bacterium]
MSSNAAGYTNPFETLQSELTDIKGMLATIMRAGYLTGAVPMPEPQKVKKYLTVQQAAEKYGYAPGTFYNWANKKQIPHIKRGGLRFEENELEAWFASHKVSTAEEVRESAANSFIKPGQA